MSVQMVCFCQIAGKFQVWGEWAFHKCLLRWPGVAGSYLSNCAGDGGSVKFLHHWTYLWLLRSWSPCQSHRLLLLPAVHIPLQDVGGHQTCGRILSRGYRLVGPRWLDLPRIDGKGQKEARECSSSENTGALVFIVPQFTPILFLVPDSVRSACSMFLKCH